MYINRTRRVLPGISTYNSCGAPYLCLFSFLYEPARARQVVLYCLWLMN
jgi:hypothetical protein